MKNEKDLEYKKYRWFFTKSDKLIYGGKSAEQNEEVVRNLIKGKENYIMMHTRIPGSPFSVIMASPEKVSESDLNEVATWTACFSRAWRQGLKKTPVDVFLTEQLIKKGSMKAGTFGVLGKIDRINVELKLALTLQKGVLRAVPLDSVKEKKHKVIIPGKRSKEEFANILSEELKKGKDEVLNALPTGGFSEIKGK